MIRNCIVCNKKIDEKNYLKDRTNCKSSYNKNRRKNNINDTLIQNKHPENDNNNGNNEKKRKVVNSMKDNNRTFIIGFSNYGKTYLTNHILYQKQEPISIFTKSLNQYLKIKDQTSDEIQLLENYENSTVVFDDMFLSKQGSYIDLF